MLGPITQKMVQIKPSLQWKEHLAYPASLQELHSNS